jgi:hypothetical protein
MGSFFELADMVAILLLVVVAILLALAAVVAISDWFESRSPAAERVKLLIGACVAVFIAIPMMLLFGFGVGHLTYVALVATYSWLTT